MRVFSTFTGIGGFEVGIQNAYRSKVTGSKEDTSPVASWWTRLFTKAWQGISTPGRSSGPGSNDLADERPLFVGYSEIDKYATAVYEHHFKGVRNYGDITKINADDLPDFDCLVGGFPCQSFSIAGKRGGFEDTRGTLFFDLARILRAKQPRLFVFENVKGLLSHDNGNTFRTIISTIAELGYDAEWQVVNSKDYGVPQNRERIIIVGHLRGTTPTKVFPLEGSNGNHIKEITRAMPQAQRVYSRRGIAPSVDTGQGGNRQAKIIDDTQGFDGVRHFDIAPTLRAHRSGLKVYTSESDTRQAKIIQRNRGKNAGGEHDIAPTMTGKSYQDNNHLIDGFSIRKLTPIECERLQAFPDNWTQYGLEGSRDIELKMPGQPAGPGSMEYLTLMSDTQRYKMCGNAVTTNVIQAVFERILS